MEVSEKPFKVMDTSRIIIARSIQNNKVIIVDNYVYFFEETGDNTLQWTCAKRDTENCRTKLITTPVVGDPSRHVVVRLTSAHTHDKFSASETEKTLKRKQELDLELGEEEQSHTGRVKKSYEEIIPSDDDENVEEEVLDEYEYDDNDNNDDNNDNDENIDGLDEEDDEMLLKKFLFKKKETSPIKGLKKFEHNKVYLLRTQHNRELVCVNGFLYRLEGKSKTSATFRWECIRSDYSCKTRIYTERLNDGRQILKHLSGTQTVHLHDSYSPDKLSNMIERHKINIVNMESSTQLKRQSQDSTIQETKFTKPTTRFDTLTARRTRDAMAAKSLYDNSKIIMLPTYKGNQVISVDKMIYNYEAKSTNKRRSYWACSYRHVKKFYCGARLVTEDTEDGLRIRKKSNEHNHADHSVEIKRRLLHQKKEIERVMPAISKNQRSKTKSSQKIDFSGYDTSSSCDTSLSNEEAPNLPKSLADMRQHFAVKDEKNIKYETTDQVEFVELIERDYSENEKSQEMYSRDDSDQLDFKPTVTRAKRGRKRRPQTDAAVLQAQYDMDVSQVSQLRSAKGGTLLCVDGYIYHMKNEATRRNYWICIKNRDYSVKCKSFVTTSLDSGELKVIHVTNKHNHPINENDIKRRLCNELTANGLLPKKSFKAGYFLNKSLDEFKAECEEILKRKKLPDVKVKTEKSKMKLYTVSDGPPSLAVRMTLKALCIQYELINVDYMAGEHMTEAYAKMNPQKEIPVLDDDGFYLSESIAIMQYICDKYVPNVKIYPKDATERALVNHRLCFNMGFYYAAISAHAMAPIFFDYPRNEMSLKKVNNALEVFETYLRRLGTKYAAGDHVTIADFALASSTLCLEAIEFDLSPYPLVITWYATFKQENPKLWEIGSGGMKEIMAFEKNPPDLSHLNHPFHPARNLKS